MTLPPTRPRDGETTAGPRLEASEAGRGGDGGPSVEGMGGPRADPDGRHAGVRSPADEAEEAARTGGRAATAWALLGSTAVFVQAVVGLGAEGLATVRAGLAPLEWAALALITAAFVYGEGVLALERRFIPHLVRRAREVRRAPLPIRLLAPLHAFSLVGASRGTLVRAWAGVAAIVLAVVVVRALPGPWRGIVDIGVAGAMAWAVVALVRQSPRAFR